MTAYRKELIEVALPPEARRLGPDSGDQRTL